MKHLSECEYALGDEKCKCPVPASHSNIIEAMQTPEHHASTTECKHGVAGACWQCVEGVTLYSGASTTDWREELRLLMTDVGNTDRDDAIALVEKTIASAEERLQKEQQEICEVHIASSRAATLQEVIALIGKLPINRTIQEFIINEVASLQDKKDNK